MAPAEPLVRRDSRRITLYPPTIHYRLYKLEGKLETGVKGKFHLPFL